MVYVGSPDEGRESMVRTFLKQ